MVYAYEPYIPDHGWIMRRPCPGVLGPCVGPRKVTTKQNKKNCKKIACFTVCPAVAFIACGSYRDQHSLAGSPGHLGSHVQKVLKSIVVVQLRRSSNHCASITA